LNNKSLIINEMGTGSYMTRTQFNAEHADVTIACALDYSTAGEKYTLKVAGDRYLKLPLNYPAIDCARMLYKVMSDKKAKTLNVAGNGMHTLGARNITQRQVNLWLHDVLVLVHTHWGFTKLICGGQTGVDIAAAVVGPVLNIPTEINMPQGYKQRLASGLDVLQSKEALEQSIALMQAELRDDLRTSS